MSSDVHPDRHAWSSRSWRSIAVRFAVGLAFADASIVVLALPLIIDELHTTISHSTYVIMGYNVALIGGVVAFLTLGRRIEPRLALLSGIVLFGVASIGCALSGSLELLVAMRCAQGLGGALLLCASLPLLAGASSPDESSTHSWAAAAAIGAAIGPAAGGLLTQLFDWRSIFIAQAPAAAIAAAAVWAVPATLFTPVMDDSEDPSELGPLTADLSLLLLSAALIGALFLSVVLLIEIWLLEPAVAAAIVTAIPLATIVTQRLGRGRAPLPTGIIGALALAGGLAVIALAKERNIPIVVGGLALCGAGIGLAFTTLTASAVSGRGSALHRAGRTVAARDAGLVLGLLVLTPVFVHDLDAAPPKAIPKVTQSLLGSPLPLPTKLAIGVELLSAYRSTPQGRLPDLDPAFDKARATAPPQTARQIDAVRRQIKLDVERTVTHSFRRSLLLAALLALLVLPVLGLRAAQLRGRHDSVS